MKLEIALQNTNCVYHYSFDRFQSTHLVNRIALECVKIKDRFDQSELSE